MTFLEFCLPFEFLVFDGENLEQLKPLYNGIKIRVGEASERPGPSVDVTEDIRLVEEELSG